MINKDSLPIKSISLVLLFALSLVGASSTTAKAQNKSIYTTNKHRVTFEAPKGNKPERTVGGASRGEQCPLSSMNQDMTLTPLLPASGLSLTRESHPTLMVYVPQTSATTALLGVRDANEDYDYQTMVSIGDRAGIVSLTLPDDAPALETDHEYQWSLILLCNNKLRPDSPVAQGEIVRVADNGYLSTKLTGANQLESAAIYADAGLWYETVSALAQLKSSNPKDASILANWESLLDSVGLGSVAKAEFVK